APSPSAAEVWDTILSPKFTRFRDVLVTGAEPHGRAALASWRPAPGARALDVGCGFGESTFDLAACLDPSADVSGLDVAWSFVRVARADAARRRAFHLRFVHADAETYEPPAPVDYVFSRFGTMFFERPVAAFRNLHAITRPGGTLVMTTWRALEDNPWLGVAKAIARKLLPAPPAHAATCGPGPFSLAEPEVVREMLERSGYRDVSLVPSDAGTLVGRTLEAAVDFQLAIGPAGEIVREAGPAAVEILPDLRRQMAEALAPFLTAEGVRMPAGAWIVHARA